MARISIKMDFICFRLQKLVQSKKRRPEFIIETESSGGESQTTGLVVSEHDAGFPFGAI
jgi:hypothetical protein